MGHCIQALVGPLAAMRRAAAQLPEARYVEIGSICLVPMTEELFNRLSEASSPTIEPFELMTAAVRERWRTLVGSSPFGYIETEYHGGQGTQAGAAWRDEHVLVRPVAGDDAVNSVLRALGVCRAPGMDEWDSIGLSQFRLMDNLLAEAIAAGGRDT